MSNIPIRLKDADTDKAFRFVEQEIQRVKDGISTVAVMTGAGGLNNGIAGLVPAPLKGEEGKFLTGDGKWTDPEYFNLSIASPTVLGGVKINGNNLSIDGNGLLSATNSYLSTVTRPTGTNNLLFTLSDSTTVTLNGVLGSNAFTSTSIPTTTDDLTDTGATNKYFTNALARASLSASTPITYNSSTGAFSVSDNAIPLAKIQEISTGSFLGRNSSSNGDIEVLSNATVKTILGIDNFLTSMSVHNLTDTALTLDSGEVPDEDLLIYDRTGSKWKNRKLVASDIPNISATKITSGTLPDARIQASGVTQHQGSINHDALTGFEPDEHIDWTTDQGLTNIHSGNYTNTSQATEFYIRDSVPTTYTIGHGKYIKFTSSGSNSPAQPTLSGSGTDASPYTLLMQYRTYATATPTSGGLMSSGDKSKLDGIAVGATNVTNNNQLTNGANYISGISGLTTWTVKVNTTNTSAMTSASSIDFVAGNGVTLSQSLTSNAKTITINADLSATAIKDLGDVQLYAPASLGDGDVLRWSDSGDEWVAQSLSLSYLPLSGGTLNKNASGSIMRLENDGMYDNYVRWRVKPSNNSGWLHVDMGIRASANNVGKFFIKNPHNNTDGSGDKLTLDESGNLWVNGSLTGTSATFSGSQTKINDLLYLHHSTRVDLKFDTDNSNSNAHYIRKDGRYLRFRGQDDSTVLFELRNNTDGNHCLFPSGGDVRFSGTTTHESSAQSQYKDNAGNVRGYIGAGNADDKHFAIATTSGEDIGFLDNGIGGTLNAVVRGNGDFWVLNEVLCNEFRFHDQPNVRMDGSAERGELIAVYNRTGTDNYVGFELRGKANGANDSTKPKWNVMAESVIGFYDDTNNKWGMLCRPNAEVELYYNAGIRLETTSNGITVGGNQQIDFGSASSFIKNVSGKLSLYSDNQLDFYTYSGGWNRRAFISDGGNFFMGTDTNGGYLVDEGTYCMAVRKVKFISFNWNANYDSPSNHGIMSTNDTNTYTDSMSINSYDDINLRVDSNNNDTASYVRFHNNTTGANQFWYAGYTGSYYLQWCHGEIRAGNDITAYYSDARLKDFHGVIENPLDKVMKLNGYYFTENKKAKELGYHNDRMQVGVSAQEVKEVLPELIKSAPLNEANGTDYMTIDYGKLTPLLIEAIKELKNELNTLKQEMN